MQDILGNLTENMKHSIEKATQTHHQTHNKHLHKPIAGTLAAKAGVRDGKKGMLENPGKEMKSFEKCSKYQFVHFVCFI